METNDITTTYATRVPSLDLTGFTIIDAGEGNNWSYTVEDEDGFRLHGVADNLWNAVHKAAGTARILRRDRGTNPTVLVTHSL
jgi:hypothetical protein